MKEKSKAKAKCKGIAHCHHNQGAIDADEEAIRQAAAEAAEEKKKAQRNALGQQQNAKS